MFLIFIVFAFGKAHYVGHVVVGFVGQLFVLIFVPTSYFFLPSEKANEIAVLGATAVAAVATDFIDSATLSLVAHYPQRVQENFQLGIGLSALTGSLYRDLTKLVYRSDQLVASSLNFFYAGAITIALCVGAFYMAMSLQLTKQRVFTREDSDVKLSRNSLSPSEKRTSTSNSGAARAAPTKSSVLKKVWQLELLVLAVYLASLSVWPPLTTEIKTYNFQSL
ncbi:unnamed protein product [Phytophthora lilii]|uniref:Unnamed protein product n=1 Tax=Phytophthora lilii TaxID=2077276 RepID=A0A9W6WVF9_9STRA|nr:unnamed protein product [Phytophthora lilii]